MHHLRNSWVGNPLRLALHRAVMVTAESIREERQESRAAKQKVREHTLLLRFPLGLLHRLSVSRQEERS